MLPDGKHDCCVVGGRGRSILQTVTATAATRKRLERKERKREGGTEGETHIQPGLLGGWMVAREERIHRSFVRQEFDIALLRVDEF